MAFSSLPKMQRVLSKLQSLAQTLGTEITLLLEIPKSSLKLRLALLNLSPAYPYVKKARESTIKKLFSICFLNWNTLYFWIKRKKHKHLISIKVKKNSSGVRLLKKKLSCNINSDLQRWMQCNSHWTRRSSNRQNTAQNQTWNTDF